MKCNAVYLAYKIIYCFYFLTFLSKLLCLKYSEKPLKYFTDIYFHEGLLILNNNSNVQSMYSFSKYGKYITYTYIYITLNSYYGKFHKLRKLFL